MRPTVNGVAPVCETHILDFSGNLYGKRVSVEFLKFIRSERKFASLDELKAQVESDIALAKAMAKNEK
jgi:riboflavin kinase/FMN adenylyltransferase